MKRYYDMSLAEIKSIKNKKIRELYTRRYVDAYRKFVDPLLHKIDTNDVSFDKYDTILNLIHNLKDIDKPKEKTKLKLKAIFRKKSV